MAKDSSGPKIPRERKAEEKLEGVSADEIEHDILSSGISDFDSKVKSFHDESMTVSPFTVDVTGLTPNALKKVHNDRTERAQDVDEQQNAPVTLDEEKWIQNKNQLDYPGVDTIPKDRQGRRASTAAKKVQDQGMLDRVEKKGSAKTIAGKFSPKGNDTYGKQEDVVRVQDNASNPERTLAHEVGHAVDFGTGEDRGFNLTEKLFDLDSSVSDGQTKELTEEAKGISKRARGDFKGQEQYRNQFKELTADVVGQSIVEPRATKRDAPELFDRVETVAEEEGLGDLFGNEDDTLDLL